MSENAKRIGYPIYRLANTDEHRKYPVPLTDSDTLTDEEFASLIVGRTIRDVTPPPLTFED